MSTLKVDSITDAAGTGAPDFPNGASLPAASATVAGLAKVNRYQEKTHALIGPLTGAGTTTTVTFNGLVAGKYYEIYYEVEVNAQTAVDAQAVWEIKHNASTIATRGSRCARGTNYDIQIISFSAIFQAVAASVTIDATWNAGSYRINANNVAKLTELNNFAVTTDFT